MGARPWTHQVVPRIENGGMKKKRAAVWVIISEQGYRMNRLLLLKSLRRSHHWWVVTTCVSNLNGLWGELRADWLKASTSRGFFVLWFLKRADPTHPTSPCVSSPEPPPQHRDPKVRRIMKRHGEPDVEFSEGLQKSLFFHRCSKTKTKQSSSPLFKAFRRELEERWRAGITVRRTCATGYRVSPRVNAIFSFAARKQPVK